MNPPAQSSDAGLTEEGQMIKFGGVRMEPLLTMYRLIFLNRHMVQKSKRAWELSCERFGFLSIQRYPIAPGFQQRLRKDGEKNGHEKNS
jgi:hypothetical protein